VSKALSAIKTERWPGVTAEVRAVEQSMPEMSGDALDVEFMIFLPLLYSWFFWVGTT
jgi:hypothetical protein